MVSDLISGINITVLSTMLRVISEAVSHIVRSLCHLWDCHCVNNYVPKPRTLGCQSGRLAVPGHVSPAHAQAVP